MPTHDYCPKNKEVYKVAVVAIERARGGGSVLLGSLVGGASVVHGATANKPTTTQTQLPD